MEWINQFPGLSSLSADEQRLLVNDSAIVSVRANTTIFGAGKRPDQLFLLLEGTVRVQQLSENGREIVLYRVQAGESCVMTTACLLAFEKYSAEGIAETDVKAVAIPFKTFDDLMSQSAHFRRFIFTVFSKRITELFHVIDDVAFQRVDARLAEKLLALAQDGDVVHMTHQQLAAELGTAREVVSRQLSEFQRRQWVESSRGVIHLIDRDSIQHLAQA